MAEKINKWTLKRISKLLNMEWSNETEQKITALIPSINKSIETDVVNEPQSPFIMEAPIFNEQPNTLDHTGFCIVECDNGKVFKVCKVKFGLTNVEVCGNFDTEHRAIFERGKLEADHRANDFRKRRDGR
jgi:hypothetical protein